MVSKVEFPLISIVTVEVALRVSPFAKLSAPTPLPGARLDPALSVARPLTVPLPASVPPEFTKAELPDASEPSTASVPESMVVAPVKVLVPESRSVPEPVLVIPKPLPRIGAEI